MAKDKVAHKGSTQSVSLKDYLKDQQKEAKKKKIKLPLPVKLALATPFLLIFCFGIYYIPFIIYQIATGPEAKPKGSNGASYQDGVKKKSSSSSARNGR